MDLSLIGKVVAILIALQAVLAGVKLGLDKVKDLTKTEVDDKADSILGKILAPLDALIGLLQGNANK